ncbi:MAG: DUF362 domain-containing protein [Planctomycetota bacterium]|nr:DUF362 domain-containing protein [Planctomycetota bacterium]
MAEAGAGAPRVSLLACGDYRPDTVLPAMRRLLAPLGGMEAFIPRGGRVVLKPNLVMGRPPERAVNTHPEIVRAAARLALEAGAGRVAIGDSPGVGSASSAARAAGYAAAAEEMGLEIIEFTPVGIATPELPFPRLEAARELLEADAVVNLPKLKTHSQMLLTLAVKNLFGGVPGARKLQWHYRAGRDRPLFARVVNAAAARIRPALSILDAVIGMDGAGPTAGRARPAGFLAAGTDPWAVDAAVMDVLGLEREKLFTLAAAIGHGPREWLDLRLAGPNPADLRPPDWDIPELRTLQMHGGFVERRLPFLARRLRSGIAPAPLPNALCNGCGHCRDICPAKAIRLAGGRPAVVDLDCIRCYCCHELCPLGGMDIRPAGLLARLLGLG